MVIIYSIHEVNYVIDKWVELVVVCVMMMENCMHLKALKSAHWHCPNSTVALKLLLSLGGTDSI